MVEHIAPRVNMIERISTAIHSNRAWAKYPRTTFTEHDNNVAPSCKYLNLSLNLWFYTPGNVWNQQYKKKFLLQIRLPKSCILLHKSDFTNFYLIYDLIRVYPLHKISQCKRVSVLKSGLTGLGFFKRAKLAVMGSPEKRQEF